jgi:ankyrin repeat protein
MVRLLASSVTNNLNGLQEIANVLSSSNQTDKKSKLINKDSGVLLRACVNNDIQTVEKILQRKNIEEYLNDINEDGDSILSLACSNGYTDLVDLILRTIPGIAVNDRGNKQDCTPLMEGKHAYVDQSDLIDVGVLACNAGHYDIVDLLIKHNANVNIQSASGNTALHYAAGGVRSMQLVSHSIELERFLFRATLILFNCCFNKVQESKRPMKMVTHRWYAR